MRESSPRRCSVADVAAPPDARHEPEADQVVRAAGLRAGADRGALPAAEGLPLHDRAGDAAVDVEVAGLDAIEPRGEVVGVLRVEPSGESVGDGVLQLDRVRERVRVHHAEHGTEELLAVEARSRLHAGADAGAPEPCLRTRSRDRAVAARRATARPRRGSSAPTRACPAAARSPGRPRPADRSGVRRAARSRHPRAVARSASSGRPGRRGSRATPPSTSGRRGRTRS